MLWLLRQPISNLGCVSFLKVNNVVERAIAKGRSPFFLCLAYPSRVELLLLARRNTRAIVSGKLMSQAS